MYRAPILTLVALLTLLSAAGVSQDVKNFINTGLPPNAAFSGSDIETVQVNNGNLHVNIPIVTKPGRGISVANAYVYDSKGWTVKEHIDNPPYTFIIQQELNNTMQMALHNSTGYTLTAQSWKFFCYPSNYVPINYVLREPDGTKHHFVPNGDEGECPIPTTRYADDGSGWVLVNGTKAIRKDGLAITFTPSGPQSQTDDNGNQLLVSNSVWTDTFGKTISTDGSYYDTSGSLRSLQVTTQTVTISTHLCGSLNNPPNQYCTEYAGSWTAPQTITLPNGLSYTFTYFQGDNGELKSITLPTGAQISYTWVTVVDPSTGYPEQRVATRTVTVGTQQNQWTYSYAMNPATTTVVDPQGNRTVYTMTCSTGAAPTQIGSVNYYAGSSQLLKTVATDYWSPSDPTIQSCMPKAVTTTIYSTAAGESGYFLNSRVETDYDSIQIPQYLRYATRGDVVEKREFVYAPNSNTPSLVRRTHFTYLHQTNSNYANLNIADRITDKVVYDGGTPGATVPYGVTYTGGNRVAETTTAYDGSTLLSVAGAPNHDDSHYGTSYMTRGNPTSVSQWLSTNGSWLTANNVFDTVGNLRSTTDPANNPTTFSYADDWNGASSCLPKATSYAFRTDVQNALNQHTHTSYFPCTGQVQAIKDQNDLNAGRQGTVYGYDLIKRVLSISKPDGGQTTYNYHGDALPLAATETVLIASGTSSSVTVHYDQLGRTQQTVLDSDPDCPPNGTKIDVTYDALGRKQSTSNPYCSLSPPDPTYGVTSYQYDALGRTTVVTRPDNGTVSTVYGPNYVTITDEAGTKRKSVHDSLGRLVQVWETDPGNSATFLYETDYSYDTLDNLTGVSQKGNDGNPANWRSRTASYDSLSRITSAYNPESGTVSYTYDADSNVLTKTSPLPNQTNPSTTVTITYGYDALNRLTGKTYSNGDPAVGYAYDSGTEAVGQRIGMTDASGSTTWAYQIFPGQTPARKMIEQRTISGITKSITDSFNFDGSLASVIYPSGRTITYAPGAAGRPLSAVDSANNIKYATAATYAPQGALGSLKNGVTDSFTGIITTTSYNNRLQPTTLSAAPAASPGQPVLSLSYDFHLGSGDNGNVFQVQNNRDTSRTVNYTYDQLNRIQSASSQATSGPNCWGQLFGHMNGSTYVSGYDPWANLKEITVTQCAAPTLSLGVDGGNHVTNTGFLFDASGNTNNDGANQYVYDAENRIKTGNGINYTYDGDGRRVKKDSGTLYWTGTGNDPLAESDLGGNMTEEYVFFDGKRIARADVANNQITAVHYYFSDHLGSASVITDAQGSGSCWDGFSYVEEESDFYPLGGERAICSGVNHYKFTGKERDAETGLDDFGARYYTSNLGRWVTPDWSAKAAAVPYAIFTDPQTLNLYTYVTNNPTTLVDNDGHLLGEFLWGTSGIQDNEPQKNSMPEPDGGRFRTEMLSAFKSAALATAQTSPAQGTSAQNLSVADVTKIIQQAMKSSSDPATTAFSIFNGLGNNVSVTGDTLRAAVKDTGVKLEGAASDLISHADSITKSGSAVTILSNSRYDTSQNGTTIHVDARVSFNVGLEKGLPGINNIKGLHAEVGVNASVDRMQVAMKGNQRVLLVTGSKAFFHKTIEVPLE